MLKLNPKIFQKDSKPKTKFPTSPDGCYYPFVLGFRTKDSGIQQENGYQIQTKRFASE